MKLFDRKRLIEKLKNTVEWDVLIIGGGATGLGTAIDAASRGFTTLLVEQEDFAKGTSSRSTKLVHGGVRYLAQGDIGLVKEALKERGLLLQNAPHITKNESFVIPCYSYFRGLFYAAGLKAYDWLAGSLSLGRPKLIRKKKVVSRLPGIKTDKLKCGVLYHDGTFDDARLAINLAQTAIENGATALNYCKLTALNKNTNGKIYGALVVDAETGVQYEIKAKVVINCTGVFADDILQMDLPGSKTIIRPSQGIHLVLDSSFYPGDDALMIPHTSDGRVLFAIPWHRKVLLGTTDTPLESHSLEPRALDTEVAFILNTAGKYLTRQPEIADVLSVFAGLRPLAATEENNQKTKEISRSHKIVIADSGLVTVIGGKWTTYRKMAEDTLAKIMKRKMLPPKKCVTHHLKIHGYQQSTSNDSPLSAYGSDAQAIKELIHANAAWGKSLDDTAQVIKAQVIWAIRNEMARTVEDVLARRTRILFSDAKTAIGITPEVAQIMKEEMGCDEAWKKQQVEHFTKLASGYLLNADSTKVLEQPAGKKKSENIHFPK